MRSMSGTHSSHGSSSLTTLDQHQSTKSVKMLFMGDSGTGKTGALASLVAAGYKLKIWDFDNGLDHLAARIRKNCPDKIKNVSYLPLKRDRWKMVGVNTTIYTNTPTDFSRGRDELESWTGDGLPAQKPELWDDNTICVLDSLTFTAKAAYRYCDQLNPGAKDKRQTFYQAQLNTAAMLSLLTMDTFHPHVIVICHIDYQETEGIGIKKGYPRSIGSAMNPEIPTYFNTALLAETVGSGTTARHMIKLAPTGVIDLKSAFILPSLEPLPLESGLATFFAAAKAAVPPAKSPAA